MVDATQLPGSKPLVIQANIGLIVGCSIVAALCIVVSIAIFHSKPISAILIFVPMAVVVLSAFLLLFKGRPYLELTSDSLSQRTSRSVVFSTPWRDMTGLRFDWLSTEQAKVPSNRWIFIDYKRDGKPATHMLAPQFFGMDADELMSLLTSYYRAATRRNDA
jgi:hypothetical protein